MSIKHKGHSINEKKISIKFSMEVAVIASR